MGFSMQLLAAGPGWRACDVVCTAGPHDRPFEERHDAMCIAAVTEGTFQYRTAEGAAVLMPGALVLGNEGHCFECGHDHSRGDRCLSFHFAPDQWETIVAAVPGARRLKFALPRLPPSAPLTALLAAAEAARDDGDAAALEGIALSVGGAVAAMLAGTLREGRRPSRSDARRVSDSLRRMEAGLHETRPLADLARDAAMSRYHFLRVFRQVVGMTPHQYVLHARLHRAAVRLRRSDDAISAIAFDAGFNDLSTFNRRFRRIIGSSPSAYRARGAAAATRARRPSATRPERLPY